MSKKRFNPLEDPPNASSSDEDDNMETTSLAGNSSSGEETEDESSALKKHQASDPESGSDEETDSDSQPETKKSPASSSAVKPITGTKNQDSKKAKPLSKSSTKKRSLSETGASTEAKKKVKSESGGGEETKKTYFQRVWSEEDEIAALQGLIDYRKDTGVSPYDDTNAFYGFVKKAISFEVSKTQLLKKLWGLKTKYENNLGKEKNGEELSFAKPHDGKAFGLSKLAWGADGVVALDSAVKSNGKSKKKSSKKVEPVKQEIASASSLPCEEEVVVKKEEAPEVDVYEKSGIVKALARFGVDEFSAQRGWSRLALEDQKRFQEEWEVLERKELEFYAKKSGFIHKVASKMAEAFQPNH